MTLVRIIKDWQTPNLLRQTPQNCGTWDDIEFTLDPVTHFDYAVILNSVPEGMRVQGARARLWALMQEPPLRENAWMSKRLHPVARIFTQDDKQKHSRFVQSHGALPWHVNKSYDELIHMPPPAKEQQLSWITSNTTYLAGHRQRMDFLKRIQHKVEFDLWGRGFTPITDKWDGLAPYRYALAIENYSGPHYWTEKVADCFLSWTMPLYFGCTNLNTYFPAESFVQIDIHAPDVAEQIKEAIQSDRWRKNRDALAHARDLVLNRYQLFPFVAEQIHQQRKSGVANSQATPDLITLHGKPRPTTKRLQKLYYKVRYKLLAFVRHLGK